MKEDQVQIARRLTLGEPVKSIALRRGVTPQSLRRYLSEIYDDTATWSQVQLAGWCVAHGVVSLAELQEVYGRGDGTLREGTFPEGSFPQEGATGRRRDG